MQNYQEQSLSPLRSLLSRLLSGWSVGGGRAPTINQPGVSALSPETVNAGRTAMTDTMLAAQNRNAAAAPPMPMAPTNQEADIMEQRRTVDGPMTDANLPAGIRARRAPGYDTAAMDYLTSPLVEGQNANIDDATRARAIAWALRNNPE